MHNAKFKRKAKRFVSGIVSVAMTATMLPTIPAFAATGTTTYSYDGYTVDYTVVNEWDSGQSVEVKITNTGEESILNWAFRYDTDGTINGIWNAMILENQGDDYLIKNNGWNYEIAPNQSVIFGYTLSDDFSAPDLFELYSNRVDVTDGYTASINVTETWDNGINGEIVITNTSSDNALEAWTLSFDSNFIINNLWDGRLIESRDNHYVISSEMWTNPISVGSSTVIGFSASIEAEATPEILNCVLSEVEIESLEIDWEDPTDLDGDGLPDVYEKNIFGTDPQKTDSDGDGLSDRYEVMDSYTNPILPDSDGNGVTDDYEDGDIDGLSNYEEFVLGTNPYLDDTDEDYLKDGEEVNSYNTDPLNPDTDNDTILDGDELFLELDPIKPDTDDNGILDCDEYFEQTVDESRFDVDLFKNNFAIPSVLTVSAKGNVNNNIEISEYTGHLKGEERAYVGKVIDITGAEISGGILSFVLSEDYIIRNYEFSGMLTNGLLICYNDGENTTPLETTYNEETRTLSANISSEGIYFVLDVVSWIESLGVNINSDNSLSAIRTSSDESTATEKGTDEMQIQTFATRSISTASESIANVNIKGQVDIVFVIDTTGSMSSYISNVKNNIIGFVTEIEDAGITPSFALVDYRDITCDGQYSTNTKETSKGSNWFKNAEDFKAEISKLTVNGGGDGPETAIDALEMARQLDLRMSSQKFFILVTDAGYKIANNYGITSMGEMIDMLVEDEINVSVVSNSGYQSTYKALYEGTGGVFANVGGNFKEELLAIADMINEETNSGCWIALNGLIPQIVKINEAPSNSNESDTDEDTLLDIKELKSIEPTKHIDVSWYLYLLGLPFDYEYPYIPVYDYYSNPAKKDSDNDKILDNKDIEPKEFNAFADDIKTYINDELIDMSQIEETDDDFLICKASISDILLNAGISHLTDSSGDTLPVESYYDDWYIYLVNNSNPTFSLFKMREQEWDDGDNNDPGVAVSFISFDISKLNDVIKNKGADTVVLSNEIDKVVLSGTEHSEELQQYFSNVKSDGSYLIAESYVNKIANLATANKVAFPENLVSLYDDIANIDETIDSIMNSLFYDSSTIAALYKQRAELSRVPDALKSINENSGTAIVDEVAKQISLVDSSSLNYYEKIAILSSFTADISFNMFAAEVKAHSDFLVDWKSSLKDWIIIGGIFEDNWYLRAIIADMSIGEEYESGLYDEYYDPDSNLVQEQITHHGEY